MYHLRWTLPKALILLSVEMTYWLHNGGGKIAIATNLQHIFFGDLFMLEYKTIEKSANILWLSSLSAKPLASSVGQPEEHSFSNYQKWPSLTIIDWCNSLIILYKFSNSFKVLVTLNLKSSHLAF